MKLLFLNQSHDRVSVSWLERWVKGLSRRLVKLGYKKVAKQELVVVLVKSPEIRRLNHLYRKKDYATDILSFEGAEDSSLGELVICMPVIRRQAKRSGLGERGELGYMLVHGALHLLGFDHVQKTDEAEMFALQDQIYADLEKRVGLK